MRQIIELESKGFIFSSVNGKLQYSYKGLEPPDSSVVLLLKEIKQNKDKVISYLKVRQQREEIEAQEIIMQAYKGQLKRPCLLPVIPSYQDLLGKAVWLCPDVVSGKNIREKYPNKLVFDIKSFFAAVSLTNEQKDTAKFILKAYKMFGGEMQFDKDACPEKPTDPGLDLSPEDSDLWIRLLEVSRAIDVNFTARLMYLRGTGCKLIPNSKTGFKIAPIIDPSGCKGWQSQEQYNAEKWCLDMYKDKLTKLLINLRQTEMKAC